MKKKLPLVLAFIFVVLFFVYLIKHFGVFARPIVFSKNNSSTSINDEINTELNLLDQELEGISEDSLDLNDLEGF